MKLEGHREGGKKQAHTLVLRVCLHIVHYTMERMVDFINMSGVPKRMSPLMAGGVLTMEYLQDYTLEESPIMNQEEEFQVLCALPASISCNVCFLDIHTINRDPLLNNSCII